MVCPYLCPTYPTNPTNLDYRVPNMHSGSDAEDESSSSDDDLSMYPLTALN